MKLPIAWIAAAFASGILLTGRAPVWSRASSCRAHSRDGCRDCDRRPVGLAQSHHYGVDLRAARLVRPRRAGYRYRARRRARESRHAPDRRWEARHRHSAALAGPPAQRSSAAPLGTPLRSRSRTDGVRRWRRARQGRPALKSLRTLGSFGGNGSLNRRLPPFCAPEIA